MRVVKGQDMLTCGRPDKIDSGYYAPMKVFDRANIRHLVVLNPDESRDRLDPKEIDAFAKFIEWCFGCFKQLQSIRIECEEYNRRDGIFFELENMMNQILAVDDKYVEDAECSTLGGSRYGWSVWTWRAHRGQILQYFVGPCKDTLHLVRH